MKTSELTADQITALKAQYGELFVIEVKVSADDTAVAYLKPADRNVMAYALQRIAKDQMVEPGEFILTNCFVGGDERLRLTTGRAENKLQISAALAANALAQAFETSVKNA